MKLLIRADVEMKENNCNEDLWCIKSETKFDIPWLMDLFNKSLYPIVTQYCVLWIREKKVDRDV